MLAPPYMVWVGGQQQCRRLSVTAAPLVRRLAARVVPTTEEERHQLMQRYDEIVPDARRVTVAVLGIPNSGKSTLINRLASWNVCAVSQKVHTTLANSRTVVSEDGVQVVLLDTPGLVTPTEARRHGLPKSLVTEPLSAVGGAQMVCVLHDVSDPRNRHGISPKVQRVLFTCSRLPALLVLTKVDLMERKRQLLKLTHHLTEGVVGGHQVHHVRAKRRPEELDPEVLLGHRKQIVHTPPAPQQDPLERYRLQGVEFAQGYVDRTEATLPVANLAHRELVLAGDHDQLTEQQLQALAHSWRTWPRFQQVLMTSALQGAGVLELRECLVAAASAGQWRYNPQLVTDQPPRQLAEDLVRSRLLEHLPAEVPYNVQCRVSHWDRPSSELLSVQVELHCQRARLARLIVRHIRLIARESEQLLRDAFRCEVILRLAILPDPKPSSNKVRL